MANILIDNPAKLKIELGNIAEEVITSVSKGISNLLRERIMKDVYEYDYYPNKYYYNKKGIPTFQFLNSFTWEKIDKSVAQITRKLFYNWASLKLDEKTFLHGSPQQGDMRQQLADILNVEGYDSGIFGGKLRQPYWDNLIQELFDDGGLDFLFSKELKKYGFI